MEQYVTSAAALVDDEDEEDEGGGVAGDDEYTSNVENKTPSDGSSESEFFSVDEDVQVSKHQMIYPLSFFLSRHRHRIKSILLSILDINLDLPSQKTIYDTDFIYNDSVLFI